MFLFIKFKINAKIFIKKLRFDHGVWSVTKLIDPEGTIPVVSISMSQKWNADEHIKLG